jgi:hypothetical protein
MRHLLTKLEEIRKDRTGGTFILADARDPDMAWGIPSFGSKRPLSKGLDGQPPTGEFRTKAEFLEEIREVVRQGIVDVLLASPSTMDRLAHKERLFENTPVTPAVRMNDTTDIWLSRGSCYCHSPSIPFSSSYIEEVQWGSLSATRQEKPVVNLGLYSMTFNNDLESDLRTLSAFRDFRAHAERCGFHYFLEVFAPNSPDTHLAPEQIPDFVNDQIARTLAGVPESGRPLFLKIPYFGPKALEDLVTYDPSVIVGILGGTSGTTHDAFKLLADAQRYGARVALFGRKIKEAEHPLAFIRLLRTIVNGDVTPEEAVHAYHGELRREKIQPKHCIEDDLQLTRLS